VSTSVSLIHPHLHPTSVNLILQQIADFDAMLDDAKADNLGTKQAIFSTAAGRSTGKFKIDEDEKLASANVL
jgi:hypothetical protein